MNFGALLKNNPNILLLTVMALALTGALAQARSMSYPPGSTPCGGKVCAPGLVCQIEWRRIQTIHFDDVTYVETCVDPIECESVDGEGCPGTHQCRDRWGSGRPACEDGLCCQTGEACYTNFVGDGSYEPKCECESPFKQIDGECRCPDGEELGRENGYLRCVPVSDHQ